MMMMMIVVLVMVAAVMMMIFTPRNIYRRGNVVNEWRALHNGKGMIRHFYTGKI